MKSPGTIERVGAYAIDTAGAAGDLGRVLLGALGGALRRTWPRGQVVQQMHLTGNRSLLFVAITLAFIGMVMVYQTCLQLDHLTGDLSLVGPQFARYLVQDLGPTLTALMLATRVGAGMAAEIGSMKVTEQIDALRMCGVAPTDYLVVPRFVACLVMTVALSVFGTLIGFAAGGFTAWSSFDVNPRMFFDLSQVRFIDLGLGLTKAVSYGMAIPAIACAAGLRARGSSEGVGRATTAAVIGASFAVIVLDFFISALAVLVAGARL